MKNPPLRRMLVNSLVLLGVFLLGFLPPFIRLLQVKEECMELRQSPATDGSGSAGAASGVTPPNDLVEGM